MKILVTGISGTGKSTIANELNKLGYNVIDLDPLQWIRWDTNSWIKQIPEIKEFLKENTVYCGTVTYSVLDGKFDLMNKLFDGVYLLTEDKKVLVERLKTRNKGIWGSEEWQRNYLIQNNDKYNEIIMKFNPILLKSKPLKEIIETIKKDLNKPKS